MWRQIKIVIYPTFLCSGQADLAATSTFQFWLVYICRISINPALFPRNQYCTRFSDVWIANQAGVVPESGGVECLEGKVPAQVTCCEPLWIKYISTISSFMGGRQSLPILYYETICLFERGMRPITAVFCSALCFQAVTASLYGESNLNHTCQLSACPTNFPSLRCSN